MNKHDNLMDLAQHIDRVEVIDAVRGRVYIRRGTTVDLLLQDEGRTLKIFVEGIES